MFHGFGLSPEIARPRTFTSLAQIPDYVAGYRANDIPNLIVNDPVATWSDISGLGNHAAQGTAAKRPTFQPNVLNGKAVVRFATDDGLIVPDSATYKKPAITLFIVCTSTVANTTVINYPHTSTHIDPYYRWGFYGGSALATIDLRVDTDVVNTSTNALWTSFTVYDYSTADRTVYRNGNLFYSGTGRTITYPNATGLRIGFNADAGECMTGDIAEIAIFGRQITNGERLLARRLLGQYYGLPIV